MKKVLSLILAAACALFVFAGCEGEGETGAAPASITLSGMRTQFAYGERFTAMGMQVTITYEDGTSRAGNLGEYSCDASAYRADTAGTYPVTVTLNGHDVSESYNVVVAEPLPEGGQEQKGASLAVADIAAWVGGQPSDFVPVFVGAQHAEIAYTYDAEAITLDAQNCTVKALKAGDVQVTATAGELSCTFTVRCYEQPDMTGADYDTSAFDTYEVEISGRWQSEATGESTVFIGDSFFDSRSFWTNFYDTYTGKDAFCFGIGSTTTYDWEKFIAEGFFGKAAPRNIVMHLGTNNLYDASKGIDETVLSLQRLFTLMHGMFPETNIYYFGISYRTVNELKIRYTRMVNEDISAWCAQRGWITYIDTPPRLTADMLRDGTHPKLECYYVFVDALAETDIEIQASQTID